MEELNIYINHTKHVKVAEFIKKSVEERVSVDYKF
ncbi:Dabb family protein [Clostridium gasigenes]|nr:Dabb family protein [Clostridium gasigenes]